MLLVVIFGLNRTHRWLQLKEERDREGAVTAEAEAVVAEARDELQRLEESLRTLAEQATDLAARRNAALKVSVDALSLVWQPLCILCTVCQLRRDLTCFSCQQSDKAIVA